MGLFHFENDSYIGANIIVFAAFKGHVGLYPDAGTMEAFKDQLEGYDTAEQTIRFPLNKPIPYKLIQTIIEYQMKEKAGRINGM